MGILFLIKYLLIRNQQSLNRTRRIEETGLVSYLLILIVSKQLQTQKEKQEVSCKMLDLKFYLNPIIKDAYGVEHQRKENKNLLKDLHSLLKELLKGVKNKNF